MTYCSLIFLLAFLPLTIILQVVDNSSEYKNFALVIMSALFLFWGRPVWILLLFLTTLPTWALGFMGASQKLLFKNLSVALAILVNGGAYAFFANAENLSSVMGFEIPALVGVGFYALSSIAYVSDCSLGLIKPEKNYFYILTYLTMFPTMLCGPLVRYSDIKDQLRVKDRMTADNVSHGFTRFIIGLSKVVILALPLKEVYSVCINSSTAYGSLFGIIVFILFFFTLFTGYTDMAIGLARIMGLTLPENFSSLDLSTGVTGAVMSFNKTVIRFIDDCVFSPVNSNAKNNIPLCIAIIIFSLILGVWFGGSAMTILFCLFIGILLVLEELLLSRFFAKTSRFIVGVYTVLAVFIALAIFAFGFADISPLTAVKNLTGGGNGNITPVWNTLSEHIFLIIFTALFMSPLRKLLKKLLVKTAANVKCGYGVVRIAQTIALTALYVICIFAVAV